VLFTTGSVNELATPSLLFCVDVVVAKFIAVIKTMFAVAVL